MNVRAFNLCQCGSVLRLWASCWHMSSSTSSVDGPRGVSVISAYARSSGRLHHGGQLFLSIFHPRLQTEFTRFRFFGLGIINAMFMPDS